jgi:branched-chain amino acid transport system substrate-binding protein
VPPAGSLRAGSRVTPLRTSSCGPALTGAGGRADLLLVAELPLQGSAQAGAQPMADAIAFVLREHRFRAGRFRLALQTCDDSTAQGAEPFDFGKCRANAKAEAADRSVVGVIGPMHSGCSFAMLPLLNGAPDGPIAVLSPTNTAKPLVRRDPMDPAGLLARLQPAGRYGYARIMPTEDYESAAVAMMARRLGGPAFYLADTFTDHGPYERWFRYAARRVGLGVTGAAVWDPSARRYRQLAARVRASGARTVVLFGSLVVNGGQLVRDLRAALDPGVRILVSSGFTPITALFEDAGDAARGVYVSAGGPQLDRRSPAGRRFARGFGATRPGGRVSSFDAYAAAATEAMLDAIARSDGTRASVSRRLTSTRLPDSPIGPVAFDQRGEPRVAVMSIARAERDLSASVPYVYNDVSGGRIVRVLTVPRRLIDPAR